MQKIILVFFGILISLFLNLSIAVASDNINFSELLTTKVLYDDDLKQTTVKFSIDLLSSNVVGSPTQTYTLSLKSRYDSCIFGLKYISETKHLVGECIIPIEVFLELNEISVKITGDRDGLTYYSRDFQKNQGGYKVNEYIKDDVYYHSDIYFLGFERVTESYYSKENQELSFTFKKPVREPYYEPYKKDAFKNYTKIIARIGEKSCNAYIVGEDEETVPQSVMKCDIAISLHDLSAERDVYIDTYFLDEDGDEVLGISGLKLNVTPVNITDLDSPRDWTKIETTGIYTRSTASKGSLESGIGKLDIIFSLPLEQGEYSFANYTMRLGSKPSYLDFYVNKEKHTLEANLTIENISEYPLTESYNFEYGIFLNNSEELYKGSSNITLQEKNDQYIKYSEGESAIVEYYWKTMQLDMYYDSSIKKINTKLFLPGVNKKPFHDYFIDFTHGSTKLVREPLLYDEEKKMLYFITPIKYNYEKDDRKIIIEYKIRESNNEVVTNDTIVQRLEHLKTGFTEIQTKTPIVKQEETTKQEPIEKDIQIENRVIAPKIISTIDKYIKQVEKKFKNDQEKVDTYIEKTIQALEIVAEKKEQYRAIISDINYLLDKYLIN